MKLHEETIRSLGATSGVPHREGDLPLERRAEKKDRDRGEIILALSNDKKLSYVLIARGE